MATLYDEIAANKLKSWLFVGLFFVLIALVVYFASIIFFGVSGISVVVIAAVLSILMSVASYWYSDKIVIALSHARPADERADAYYVNVVEGLALAAGIPKPKAFVIEDDAINALATGRDPAHAAVCVTTGALRKLKRAELEGVVAHEFAHVKNYDVRLATIAAVMAGFVIILADVMFRGMLWGGAGRGGGGDRESRGPPWLVVIGVIFLILSPIFATLIKAALSRKRESLADASGVMLTRYPDGLIGALRRIKADAKGSAVAAPSEAIAHLYFANPLSGKAIMGLFSTHPPLEERIAVLERYALENRKK